MNSTALFLSWLVAAAGAQPTAQTLSGEALSRYQEAVSQVQAGAYGPATSALNALAADYPRVAEVFATRCSAQLGLRRFDTAEADCDYAYRLKPSLSSALYGLASAEERQGKHQRAVDHYKAYAALEESQAPFKAQALARVTALTAPPPSAGLPVAAPPDTTEAPPAPAQQQQQQPAGTLFIYRNHFFQGGNNQVTLLIDDQVVGDIGHDQYVELQLPAGEHIVEASIGGLRYSQPHGLFFQLQTSSDGRVQGGSLGNGPQYRLKGITVPIEVPAHGRSYVNFDHVGGRLMLQQVDPQQAVREMREDCSRAYSRKL